MGQQRRYGKQGVDGYEVPTGGRRQQLEDAVQTIYDHVRQTGLAGIYSGDGTWRAPATDQLLAPMLEGPDRVRRGERVDGADTILAAHPTETREDIQDRLYRSRHYASPRMLTRHRIAEVLYAGIGAGLLEPVRPPRSTTPWTWCSRRWHTGDYIPGCSPPTAKACGSGWAFPPANGPRPPTRQRKEAAPCAQRPTPIRRRGNARSTTNNWPFLVLLTSAESRCEGVRARR